MQRTIRQIMRTTFTMREKILLKGFEEGIFLLKSEEQQTSKKTNKN